MSLGKSGRFSVVVLELRHVEDGVDSNMGRQVQLIGHGRDNGGDTEGSQPSGCQFANLGSGGEWEVGVGEEDRIAHIVRLWLSMLVGVLFLAVLGG